MALIQTVSKQRIVSRGFEQAFYADDSGNFEILFNKVAADAVLPMHDHALAQFGYCFSGTFIFSVPHRHFTFTAGSSYDLPPHMPHGARVKEDILTFDFKYKPDRTFDLRGHSIDVDVLSIAGGGNRKFVSSNITVVGLAKGNSGHSIGRRSLPFSERIFVLAPEPTGIIVGSKQYELSPMQIYSLKEEDESESGLHVRPAACSDTELFVLQID